MLTNRWSQVGSAVSLDQLPFSHEEHDFESYQAQNEKQLAV